MSVFQHTEVETKYDIWMHMLQWKYLQISLDYVPKGLIDNQSPMVQLMAWCRTGAKPFSQPVMGYLLVHNGFMVEASNSEAWW